MAPQKRGGKKQSKHTVKLVPTFKKKKVKVGRSLPKGVNDTKINIQTRGITILQQFSAVEKRTEADSSSLTWPTIQPILAHFTHHNAGFRRNALSALRNKLKHSSAESHCAFFNEILRAVCPHLSDSDEQCRKVTNETLKLLIEAHSESELRPFEALIVANLNVALTSGDNCVRRDALFGTFDMLVETASRIVRRHAATLLRNVIELTTKRIVQTASITNDGKSAAESSATVIKSRSILANTDGAITSLRNRARLLERLRTLFSIAIEGCPQTEEADSEADASTVRELCIRSASHFGAIALQLVVEANETLADFEEDPLRRGASASQNLSRRDVTTATECLFNAVRILNTLFSVFSTDLLAASTSLAIRADAAQFRETLKPIRKELVRQVLRRFPFGDAPLDDQVCRLVLHFYALARTTSQRVALRDAFEVVSQYVETRIDEQLQSRSSSVVVELDEVSSLANLAELFLTDCEPANNSLRTKLLKMLELALKYALFNATQVAANQNLKQELIERFVRVLEASLSGYLQRSLTDPLSLACYSAVELLPRLFTALHLDCEALQVGFGVRDALALAIRRCLVDRVLRCATFSSLIQLLVDTLKRASNEAGQLILCLESLSPVALTDTKFLELTGAILPFTFYIPSSCDLLEERRIYVSVSQLFSQLAKRLLGTSSSSGDRVHEAAHYDLCRRLISIVASRYERCVAEQAADDVQVQFLPNRLSNLLSFFLTLLRDAVVTDTDVTFSYVRPSQGNSISLARMRYVVAFSAAIRDSLTSLNDMVHLSEFSLTRTFITPLADILRFDAAKMMGNLKTRPDVLSPNVVCSAVQVCAMLELARHTRGGGDTLHLRELAVSLHQSYNTNKAEAFCQITTKFLSDWLRNATLE